MLDLARYKGLLIVGLGLYCAVTLCNAALVIGLGESPAIFDHPDRQLAWSQLQRSGSQVAGVELQMRRGGLDHQPPFGVILGQSTALRGIDPVVLEQQAEPHMPWLLVNGFGGSFVKLNIYAQTLLVSELRPRMIVLGLHETMLAGQDRANGPARQSDGGAASGPTEKKRSLPRQIKRTATAHWVRKQRAIISHFTNMGLFELRLALHKSLDLGAAGLFHPNVEPWRVLEREELAERHDGQLTRQRENWRDFGWFEAKTYDTMGQQADAFRGLIAGCDGLGAEQIVIVWMPITSDLRGWLPAEAGDRMRSLIDEASVGRPVRVIDLRSAMPDKSFADYAHLNPLGREVFSRLLAERLSEVGSSD